MRVMGITVRQLMELLRMGRQYPKSINKIDMAYFVYRPLNSHQKMAIRVILSIQSFLRLCLPRRSIRILGIVIVNIRVF
jgi:hypothetical protein